MKAVGLSAFEHPHLLLIVLRSCGCGEAQQLAEMW
jgi:hypothetical protein